MLKVGQAVAKQVAMKWLAEKRANSRRGRDLTKLIRARFPIRRDERAVLDELVKIEDEVAKQLAPGLSDASHGVPANEREAAFNAVSDALDEVDLSDTALFTIDLSPEALAAIVRKQQPVERVALSERATGLYDVALDRACIVLTHLIKELPEFTAAAAVENLTRLRTLIEGTAEILARVPVRRLSAPYGMDFDEQFRRRYLDRVVRSYNRLEVIGLTTHTYEPRTTLSVAYISLTVTEDSEISQEVLRHSTTDWLNHNPSKPQTTENVRVELALGGSQLTVIRGEAGAGKSTLLRWLAVNSAQGTFTDKLDGWNECVPFLVKLRDFPNGPLPRGDELLTQPSSPQCGPIPSEWVHRQLESGHALLLVDGVDELVAQRRNAVRQWLRELLNGYPKLRVVVTSRPTAVGSRWLAHEGFRSVVLEPMTSADVQVFLRRWHSALLDSVVEPELLPCRPEEVPGHLRSLLAQLQARTHLRALARSPLLCAMLCALNLDRRARLPRDRLALYSAALEMLLERRDADRSVLTGYQTEASANEKLVLLRVLAWWLNENGRTEMSREQALTRMTDRLRGMPNIREDAENLLDHLIERSGVIRQPVQGRVDFIHRTFQEFLAAREAIDRDSIDLLVTRARSDLWRETVLMACAQGSEEQRGRLLSGILDQATRAAPKAARQLNLLAAACKETAILAPPDVLDRVDNCIRSLVPPRSVRESRSLATVGESVLDYLPTEFLNLSTAQAAACVRTASLVNGPRALEKLSRYTFDSRVKVQEELIRAWKYFDPESYARSVLAKAPLVDHGWTGVEVDFAAAVPFLYLLQNLRHCRVNLWQNGPIAQEIHELGKLNRLTNLVVLGDMAPETLPELGNLQGLERLFINFTSGWPITVEFISRLNKLRDLSLVNAQNVVDFSPLRRLPNLESVNFLHSPVAAWINEIAHPEKIRVMTCFKVEDNEILTRVVEKFPNVQSVSLDDCLNLRDLRPLSQLPIKWLSINNCAAVNIEGIANHATLRRIRIARTSQNIDLTPLADQTIKIYLGADVTASGIEELGPGVILTREGR
ncbi:NACHT domain-containing protein [Amycolatopsis roodepoortensis]|uniref:NACHT domain-containing protein n=1 Tax=Amycolatopsis roodepoortensis TaxID=700274 RepID=A0ABR9KZV7_9PSEU|nr:NACHT domain-containing protein [Amycolatopsis roodepoortensis]MBE1573877.1 hypothetical protein [Amycolatopsis roodepoortensis]